MKLRRCILDILKVMAAIYLMVCLFMWGYQRHIIFLPQTEISPPTAYGLDDFTDSQITSADGIKLQIWQHAAREGYPTVIYFHGNGGNLSDRAQYFKLLSNTGFGVLGLSYRGYGLSQGTPSETGFYEDARAAIEYASHTLSLKPAQMIFYGESLGTGVAVQMATEYPSAALVLQSPYASIDALAKIDYPWLPVSLLLNEHFDSLNKIPHIHTPLLLLHGEKDKIVPIRYGRMVFAAAPEPKQAIFFPQFGHNDFDLNMLTKDLLEFCMKYKLVNNNPGH